MAETELQKKRKKFKVYSLSGAVLLAGILILANFVMGYFPLRLDTSEGRVYSLSSGTKNILKQLDDRLIIRALISSDLPPRFKLNQQYIRDLLSEYTRASHGKIKVEMFDPGRSAKDKQDAISAGVYPVQLNVIKKDRQEIQECFLGLSLLYADKKESISFIQNTDGLEYEISQRIKKMVKPTTARIGFVTNGKALTLASEPLKELGEAIRQLYQTAEINLNDPIPADVKALWLIGPKEPLEANAIQKLREFVQNGGILGLLIDKYDFHIETFRPAPLQTGLDGLLNEWGVEFRQALVADPQSDRIQIRTAQGMFQMIQLVDYPYFPLVTNFDHNHPATKNLDGVSFPLVSPFFTDKAVSGITYTTLAQSSPKSWLDPMAYNVSPLRPVERPADAPSGPFKLGLMLEGKFNPNDPTAPMGRVIMFGCSRFIRSDYPPKPTNLVMFANFLDWSLQEEALLSMRAKGAVLRPLKQVSDPVRLLVKYSLILILPLLSLAIGFLILLWNKKRVQRLKLIYQGI